MKQSHTLIVDSNDLVNSTKKANLKLKRFSKDKLIFKMCFPVV